MYLHYTFVFLCCCPLSNITSRYILCYCGKGIYVEDLTHEATRKELIYSVIEEKIDKSSKTEDDNFPKNYQTCIRFYQVLRNMAQSGMEIDIISFLQLKVTFLKVIAESLTEHDIRTPQEE